MLPSRLRGGSSIFLHSYCENASYPRSTLLGMVFVKKEDQLYQDKGGRVMTYRIISADSHMTEPPDLWASRLDVKFRDHAPKVIDSYEGKKGAYFVCEGLKPFPVGGIFGFGESKDASRSLRASYFRRLSQ